MEDRYLLKLRQLQKKKENLTIFGLLEILSFPMESITYILWAMSQMLRMRLEE